MSAEQTPDIADVVRGLLTEFPTDATGHVTSCGYDDNEICGCYSLPERLRAALAPVLAAAVREAEQRALRSVDPLAKLDALHAHVGLGDEWQASPRRAEVAAMQAADRITEPVSHEAATSGEEASKA